MGILSKTKETAEEVIQKDPNWSINYWGNQKGEPNKRTTRYYEQAFNLIYNEYETQIDVIYFPPDFDESVVLNDNIPRDCAPGRLLMSSRWQYEDYLSDVVHDGLDLETAIYDYCQKFIKKNWTRKAHFNFSIEYNDDTTVDCKC